jgi:hypothetical protein
LVALLSALIIRGSSAEEANHFPLPDFVSLIRPAGLSNIELARAAVEVSSVAVNPLDPSARKVALWNQRVGVLIIDQNGTELSSNNRVYQQIVDQLKSISAVTHLNIETASSLTANFEIAVLFGVGADALEMGSVQNRFWDMNKAAQNFAEIVENIGSYYCVIDRDAREIRRMFIKVRIYSNNTSNIVEDRALYLIDHCMGMGFGLDVSANRNTVEVTTRRLILERPGFFLNKIYSPIVRDSPDYNSAVKGFISLLGTEDR